MGIVSLGDPVGPTLMTFNQVVEKYGISKKWSFRYFQVRDFISKDTSLPADVTVTEIEKKVLRYQGRAAISTFNACLGDCLRSGTRTLEEFWEKELGITITERMWDDIWNNSKRITVRNWTRAMQLKILHRTHVAISPNISPECQEKYSCVLDHWQAPFNIRMAQNSYGIHTVGLSQLSYSYMKKLGNHFLIILMLIFLLYLQEQGSRTFLAERTINSTYF